jgi:hypothetical protein
MFKNVKCVNTINGKLITWDILEGHYPMYISVYGTYEGKGWTLLQSNCLTGQYLDPIRTVGLSVIYKLVGVDRVGNRTEINNIGAATYESKAGLLAKEVHRRETTLFRTHPYGKADTIILMHKQSGDLCETCANTATCPTHGPNTACTECFGTGYKGGYYIYPKAEPMLMVDAHDDQIQPPPELPRNGAFQVFRTAFTGMIREHDLLCIGMDLYRVTACQCVSSIAGIPVAYQLQTVKILPEDIRYKLLLPKVRKVFDERNM